MLSSHTLFNYLLFVVLIVLLLWCCHIGKVVRNESFVGDADLSGAPFTAEPTVPYTTSVFSSYPPEHKENRAWTFATPFQSACMNGNTTKCDSKCCQQKFVCKLSPHNRRLCRWE